MKSRKNKSVNTEKATRFKLYKSGKLWIIAGITACSILGGSFMQSTAVHADAVSEATSIHMVNNETQSVSVSDTQAISNEESSKNTTSPKATTTTGSSTQKTGVLSNSTSTTQASSLTGSQASDATVSESSSQASMTSNNDSNTAGSSTDSTVGSQAVSAVASEASSQGSNATSTAPVKDASSPVGSNAVTSSNSQSSETSASSNQVASTATKATPASAASSVTSQPVTAKKATLNLMTVSASAPATDVWNIGDTTRPRVDVVDVASYQSTMTQSDYNKLKAAGIKTVIIKATEGTGYTNPAALAQARMANAAGLNADHVQYRNRYATVNNQLYYFGSNGDAITGLRHYGNNKLEYYGADHVQYRNRYYRDGSTLYYFGNNGDAVRS